MKQPTLEKLRMLKELHKLEHQRWVEWVQLGLILPAFALFGFSFWRTLLFLEHATDTQISWGMLLRLGAHLLGLGTPGYFLMRIYRHYFPVRRKRK